MSNDEMGRMLAAKMACQLEISKIDLTADGLRAMIPIMQEAGIIDKKNVRGRQAANAAGLGLLAPRPCPDQGFVDGGGKSNRPIGS